jgi:N-acetyl-gamma-glutamyl-phosphate reductase
MDKIRVGIIGAGGYGGCGAVELLSAHPHVEIGALMDKQDVGKPMSDLYPHLAGFCDMTITDPDAPDCPDDFDVVFFSTPDGVGQEGARHWLDKGVKVVDYSGDFRFDDPEVYRAMHKGSGGRNPTHPRNCWTGRYTGWPNCIERKSLNQAWWEIPGVLP